MKNKFLALLISSAFLFAACGDDSSSASADPSSEESSSSMEEGDDSSSSEKGEAKSSSSKKGDKSSSSEKSSGKSSSSAKEDSKSSSSESPKSSSSEVSSSSIVLPEGTRAAKLSDLQKNHELKLFDQTVYLSTGSKQGLVALRIPDELWAVSYTDFANGVISFEKDNTGMQYSETDAAKKIAEKVNAGFKISFVVKEGDNADEDDVILYSVNGSDFSEAVKASVAVQKGKISKAEVIKDSIYKCIDGDTTRIFRFFDSSYIYETSVGDSVENWHAGRYDIQRSTLLMLPVYYSKSSEPVYTYSVGSDNTISLAKDAALNCTVEKKDYEYENPKDFIGNWVAKKEGLDWNFSLKADGTFELSAVEGDKKVESKDGAWEIYGYYLMLRNEHCLQSDKCTKSIHGQLQTGPVDRETGKISGFSFIHFDTDTPKIPTSFDAPENKE